MTLHCSALTTLPLHYTTLHCTARHYTAVHSLHYATLNYSTLHYTMYYTTLQRQQQQQQRQRQRQLQQLLPLLQLHQLHQLQKLQQLQQLLQLLQLQLQIQHCNYNYKCIALHYTTLHPAVLVEVTTATTPNSTTPTPFGPSMDSLCHPCIKATHLSYSVLSLKLPPPSCPVLLVVYLKIRACGMYMMYMPQISIKQIWGTKRSWELSCCAALRCWSQGTAPRVHDAWPWV